MTRDYRKIAGVVSFRRILRNKDSTWKKGKNVRILGFLEHTSGGPLFLPQTMTVGIQGTREILDSPVVMIFDLYHCISVEW